MNKKNYIKILGIIVVLIIVFTQWHDITNLFKNGGLFVKGDSVVNPSPNSSNDKVSLPGPLRVFNSLFTGGEHSTPLTVSGVILITNDMRKMNGELAALKENTLLNQSAQKKLDDMFANGYFEHISPAGITLANLADDVDYDYIVVGENLALGDFKDDKSLVEAWMASPGHRENILNDKYTEIGVAVGNGVFEGHKTWIAVQHFGRPASECPFVDKAKKASIDKKEKQLAVIEDNITRMKAELDNSDKDAVEAYNREIETYNALLTEIKKEIAAYNKSVRDYNTCVGI